MSLGSSELPAVDEAVAKARFKAKIKRWDKWGTGFAFLVCVGLVMEYSLPWLSVQARYWLSSWITHWPYLHLMQIAHLFVAGGVAGELLAHWKQSNASDDLTRLQERDSDVLKLQVAKTNLAMEELRRENLKLKGAIAPRGLTPSQFASLRDFALVERWQEMDVLIMGGVGETMDFAQLITMPFRISEWDVRFFRAPAEINERGISIYFPVWAKPEDVNSARDLCAVFSFINMPCKPAASFNADDKRGDPLGKHPEPDRIAPIRMIVGEKPRPNPTSDSPASPQ